MCDFPPVTADPPENYVLNNVMSPVGQVVTAYCKNTTVAIVKCLPNLTWNATVPSCSVKDRDSMSTLLIILWAVGGLLLFSLIILIVVIVTSKSKRRCGLRGNGTQNASIFHISGRGHGRGGDNPAFSRADEICGEWSYHRGDNFPDSHRLPSYHEAILNNYITVPARGGSHSHQDVPVSTSTTIQPSYQNQNSDIQRTTNNMVSELNEPQSERTETANQIADEQNNGTNQIHDTTLNSTPEQRDGNDQADSSRNQRNTQEVSTSSPRRYAEHYPQCFFEEEPPPPYSPEPVSSPSYQLPQQNQQDQREHNPGRRRTIHAIPSSQSILRQNENDHVQNSNFRRSMCDRLVSTSNSESTNASHRRHTRIHTSIPSSSITDTRQKNTRFGNRTVSKTFSTSPIRFTSDVICATNHYIGYSESPVLGQSNGNYISGHSNGNYISGHSNRNRLIGHSDNGSNNPTNTFQQIQNSVSNSDALQNLPSHPAVTSHNIYSSNQSYAATVNFDNNRGMYMMDNRRIHESTNEIPRVTLGGLPYLPHSSSSHSYHNETLPLGTSTPVNQSPAEIRRFVPANHPPPLSIPRNLPHHHSRQNTTNICQGQPMILHPEESLYFPHVARSAPLARFDGDYTYL